MTPERMEDRSVVFGRAAPLVRVFISMNPVIVREATRVSVKTMMPKRM